MFLLAALAGIFAIGFYHFRHRRSLVQSFDGTRVRLPALLLVAFVVLLVAGGAEPEVEVDAAAPTFVAIAVDVSSSMGVRPDPDTHPDTGTRMERARRAVLEVVARLDASRTPVMMSLTAFTVRSQPILVWDDNLAQVREVVEHVLVPGLLTEPGSDPGAAVQGVLPLFDNLPEAYRNEASERLLIVVSDGEATAGKVDLTTELAEARSRGIRIVSLHVGALDAPEGLPLFDEDGVFRGFREVGGELYSVPDPQMMSLIAGSDSDTGRYVEVEAADAATRIAEFVGLDTLRAVSDDFHVGILVTLLSLAVMILLWFV